MNGGQNIGSLPMTAVPGQMLSQTPPQSATAGSSVDAQTQKILNMLMNSISQRRFAGQPRPSPVPGLTDPREAQKIGMNTAWPHAWGFERFAAGLQASIGNAVSMYKESQIQKAEAIYDYYGNLWNNLEAAKASRNQEAIQEAQGKMDKFVMDRGNLNALHKAAKWLNQSWLDPEKTDAWGTAYSRSLAKQKQKDQARSGIVNLFRHAAGHLLGLRQQPQLTPEESVQAGRQIQERAPSATGQLDPKTIVPFATVEERVQAQRDVQTMKDQAQKEIEKMKEDAKKDLQKPVDRVLAEAKEAYGKGDMETYRSKLKVATEMSSAAKGPGPINQFTLLARANAGDQDAAKVLREYYTEQQKLAMTRGQAFGMGRAMYNIQAYVDTDTQRIVPMSAFDATQAIKAGKNLVLSGRLPASMITQAQRLISEALPAIDAALPNLKAFDNSSDRAVFARVMGRNPAAAYGQEVPWLGNILDQALNEGLSNEGKAYVQDWRRLTDSLGLLRATLGLPATESMTALAIALTPGPTTPDSKFAQGQMDRLKLMIQNAVEIPALKGVAKPGGKTIEYKIVNGQLVPK